ncbi:uracil-DNA glycosylase [Paracoccus sp. p3-h83]|uniref:uracil-DNA glycosylase n=1 Tax=Paracoccus sp. p3-h83 TaxID=3342805 RepID=UPI0035B8408F
MAALDADTAAAMLIWQREWGVDEPICDAPVNRYDTPRKLPEAAPPPVETPALLPETGADPVELARAAATAAPDLAALAQAMRDFDPMELRQGARNFVFADGNPQARVMIVGEAPGAEEDARGLPFVGKAGQLLDRMFAAIGLSRAAPDAQAALYITNVLCWRPPGNRKPEAAEIAMMLPFLERHIDLIGPDLVVMMGNTPCQALLGQSGILRLRGTWATVAGRPAMPMTHPAYLLRNPAAKREAWADLLAIQARLRG